jgi:hypothetical protein
MPKWALAGCGVACCSFADFQHNNYKGLQIQNWQFFEFLEDPLDLYRTILKLAILLCLSARPLFSVGYISLAAIAQILSNPYGHPRTCFRR